MFFSVPSLNQSFNDAPQSSVSTETIGRSGRRMMPLRSQVGFSAGQQAHRTIMPHEVDHNYERRPPVPQLSRHQRGVDDLENQDEPESLSSRLRHRTLQNSTSSNNLNGTSASGHEHARITRSRNTHVERNSDSDDDNTPLNIVACSSRSQVYLTSPSNSNSHSLRSSRRKRLASDDERVSIMFETHLDRNKQNI